MTTLLFVRCIRPLSSVVKKKVSPLARFHKVNFFIGSFKKNNRRQKKRKKEHAPKETADKIFYIREREREREREDEDEEEDKR